MTGLMFNNGLSLVVFVFEAAELVLIFFMIKTENNKMTITCDKCSKSQTESLIEQYKLYDAGWAICGSARKYHHLCRGCQTKKQRSAHDFVNKNFNVK